MLCLIPNVSLFPIACFLIEGPFQSDALLVPEGCLFDHIHNASRCWPFVRWNQTGAAACQDRGMQMRSFAMLLPCGISLFSGVEFVCCPKHFKGKVVISFIRFFPFHQNEPAYSKPSPLFAGCDRFWHILLHTEKERTAVSSTENDLLSVWQCHVGGMCPHIYTLWHQFIAFLVKTQLQRNDSLRRRQLQKKGKKMRIIH